MTSESTRFFGQPRLTNPIFKVFASGGSLFEDNIAAPRRRAQSTARPAVQSDRMSPGLEEPDVTRLLDAWRQGDRGALEALTPLVQGQLRQLAHQHLAKERPGHLLQPTALVNEVFIRLTRDRQVAWANRAQFYAVSARLMRQILIDFARQADAGKRGRRATHLDLGAVGELSARDPGLGVHDLLDIDRALERLAALDSRQAQLVELRFFGGLENAEIAHVLGVSEATVARDWRLARAWLYDALAPQC